MSKIEELIKEKCPNGVRYDKLCSVIKSYSSGLNPRQNFKLDESGASLYYVTVKEITTGKILFSDKTDRITLAAWNKIQNRSKLEVGDVLLSGIGTIGKVALVDIPVDNWNCSESVILLKPKKELIISKYLVHLLRSNYVQNQWANQSVGSTLKGLRKENVLNTRIAVPPLEVQEEIVRILDKFCELEAQLEIELEVRKSQYKFWRGKLLNKNGNIKIKDFFTRVKGTPITAGKMKEIAVEDGDVRIFAGGQTKVDTTVDNIPKDNIINYPCVIVQSRGLIDFIYYDKPFTFKNEMWAYTCDNKIIVKYLYYYLKNNVNYFRMVGGQMGSMPQISLPVTERYEVYLPDIKEQERIVNFLDRFEILINDISEGLPAEIELRRKQYEYYRNKLLSFEVLKDE